MIKYACERGSYIIANRILTAKPRATSHWPNRNPLQYLMYIPKPPPNLRVKSVKPKPKN